MKKNVAEMARKTAVFIRREGQLAAVGNTGGIDSFWEKEYSEIKSFKIAADC